MGGFLGIGGPSGTSSVGPLASGQQYASLLASAAQPVSNIGPVANGSNYSEMLGSIPKMGMTGIGPVANGQLYANQVTADPLTRLLGLDTVSGSVGGTNLGILGRLANVFPGELKGAKGGGQMSPLPGFPSLQHQQVSIPQQDLMSFLTSLSKR